MVQKWCFTFLVVSACAVALAAPPQVQPRVIREFNDNDGLGNYRFTYELDNGQIFSEIGTLKNVGDHDVITVVGQYSYVGDDGQTYWVNYTADENGFHPVVGTGPGGIGPGGDAQIGPNALKSLIGK